MRPTAEAAVLVALALAAGAIAALVHPELRNRREAALDDHEVRLEQIKTWKEPVVWVDARPEAAYREAHVPGAIHLEESDFDHDLAGLVAVWTPGQRIVVYCSAATCGSARSLAGRLREAGFPETYYLHGGWETWSAAR
jgi:rhodanese-related sulfurtransferase